jgi:hypothetical protein
MRNIPIRNVYSGSNGANNVFSFLPTSGTVTSFSGDLNLFLKVNLQTVNSIFGKLTATNLVFNFKPGIELFAIPDNRPGR